MNNKYIFDNKLYDFVTPVKNLFNCELNKLHLKATKSYNLFTEIGKDSHTEFHKIFYNKLNSSWPEIENIYKKFIYEVIFPFVKKLTGEDEFAYQKFPTLRIHLPNNVAVVKFHYDSDNEHNHPEGEINFVLPLTKMYETNSIYVESEPNKGDFLPFNSDINEFICWNFNKCNHGNKINKTNHTRLSFDFRILPMSKYFKDNITGKGACTKRKFCIGHYYNYLSKDLINQYISKDPWDREKEFFNVILNKYKVKDPWDIVDLFEKKVALYAGSNYAVSVDNCTNALFLCLKYLNASNTITIPSRTYVSVPCTIINAGCKVQFEDIKWSGAYQLKPYPVYDGAVRFRKNMYKANTFHCLSFHIRKHIPIGKGGMILTDDKNAYKWFKLARYEGRHIDEGVAYKDDWFDMTGWNMYMTPEQAAKGLNLLEKIHDYNDDQESSGSCKDLSKYDIFTKN